MDTHDETDEASDRRLKIIPDGWVPIAPALAWVAFGTAEDAWDESLFFGASLWFEMHPGAVSGALHRARATGRNPFRGGQRPAESLAQALDYAAADIAGINVARHIVWSFEALLEEASESLIGSDRQAAMADIQEKLRTAKAAHAAHCAAFNPEIMVRAAEQLLASLSDAGDLVDEMHDAIGSASESLRRAIGRGCVPAFGRVGATPMLERAIFDLTPAPCPEGGETAPPRQRIPADVCQAPVTLTQSGILPFAHGYDLPEVDKALWSDILIDAHDLLRLWPVPDDEAPSAPYRPPSPDKQRQRGGRPQRDDWVPFQQQVSRRLALDGGNLTITAFRRQMKAWAAENMESPPDDRSIERRIDALVPRDIFVSD